MGNTPSVCAIMLTRDRPDMACRAVECFRAQTYPRKTLLIVNSGCGPITEDTELDVMEPCYIGADAQTIGELRNRGAHTASGHNADILIHWDDDDYSHPNRIAEQVALLQSSGADCVGYREMLFSREPRCSECGYSGPQKKCPAGGLELTGGEAWLYSAQGPEPQLLGTSLCYWRKAWERQPFEATSHGEDAKFCAGLRCIGVSAMPVTDELTGTADDGIATPRMIARIHSGNTSTGYTEQNFRAAEWRRVPEWDSYCRGIFA